MKPSRIKFLELSDLEQRIEKLEKKHGLTTPDFLAKKKAVPEDDELKWHAYLSQRRHLREHYQQIRGNYLDRVGQPTAKKKTSDIELAA